MNRRQSQQDATSAAIAQLRLKAAASKSKKPACSRSLLNSPPPTKQFTRVDLELACRRRRRVGKSLNGNNGNGSGNTLQISRFKGKGEGTASSSPYNAKTKRAGFNKGNNNDGNNKSRPISKATTSPGTGTDTDKTAAAAIDIDTEGQVRSLDNGVKLCARKYNDCKAEADRLAMELQKRLDEQASLEKEAAALDDMIAGNNSEAQRIASLTDEINDAITGADEKLHYRLQLNHMLQRCRKNSVSLDKHFGAMTDTLEAARKEQEQCERMLGEVEAGFSDAVRSLESTVRSLEIEKDERNRTLADKRSDAKNSSMLETWRNERETSRQDLENSLGGNLRQEKEELKEQIRQRQRDIKLLNKEVGTKVSVAGDLEEIATKIKQATGLNDLEEIIEKLQHAKDHHEKMLLERGDAEDRLRAARHMLQDANVSSQHNATTGYGDTELNRYLQDELSQSINNEQTQGKVVRSTNVRLEAVLVGLRQGSMGLYQKLLPFHPTLLDCDPPKLSDTTSSSPIQAAYETLEILKISSHILGKMLDAVGGIDRVIEMDSALVGESTRSEAERGVCENDAIDEYSNPNSSARENCRVEANTNRRDSPPVQRGSDGGGCDVRDSDVGYQRCPSRGTMKRAASMSERAVGSTIAPISPGKTRAKLLVARPPREREDPLKRVDTVCQDPLLE